MLVKNGSSIWALIALRAGVISRSTTCCKEIDRRFVQFKLTYNSVCDKSVRYVAEENIAPVADNVQPSEAMLKLAGRHFKRWDEANHVFVSNVRDEYPDD
jgi:hypothetical protein